MLNWENILMGGGGGSLNVKKYNCYIFDIKKRTYKVKFIITKRTDDIFKDIK